jgi:hypothetical protein
MRSIVCNSRLEPTIHEQAAARRRLAGTHGIAKSWNPSSVATLGAAPLAISHNKTNLSPNKTNLRHRTGLSAAIRRILVVDCCGSYFAEFPEMGLAMVKAQGGMSGSVSGSKIAQNVGDASVSTSRLPVEPKAASRCCNYIRLMAAI